MKQGAYPWRQHLDTGLEIMQTHLASVSVYTVSRVGVGSGLGEGELTSDLTVEQRCPRAQPGHEGIRKAPVST